MATSDIRRLLLAALALAAAPGLAAAAPLSATWRSDAPPALTTKGGQRLTLDGPLGGLERNAQDVAVRPPNLEDLAHGATRLAANCVPRLDSRRVLQAAEDVLRRHEVKWTYASENPRQVVLIGQPTISSGRASFYSFLASLEACTDICRLRISAKRMVAPIVDRVIRLNQVDPRMMEDDIAAELAESAAGVVIAGCRS
jgi:DNA-binding transcriptional regulator YdaS (Cro superfamily)